MISYLKGIYQANLSDRIVIDVGGVGYGVAVGDRVKNQAKPEEELAVYVYTHVRDDVLDLYGFDSREELELFQLLLQVSGVGPKSALLIVDRGVEAVKQAIIKADTGFFTTIPRIGKKNAQKIIIELKSKLGSLEELDLSQEGGETQEVMEALQAVGFSRQEAIKAVRQLPEELTSPEEKVRHALKHMEGNNDNG